MENSEDVNGAAMNTRNWLLVVVVDVLILVELAAAMRRHRSIRMTSS
jgi:hypothetical protein